MTSEYKQVLEFTKESGYECSDEPKAMTKQEVKFVTSMVLDELMELMVTIEPCYKLEMIKMIINSRDLPYKKIDNEIELIAEQADAMVDANYYMLNAACKNGMQLDKIFQEVHMANMNKRDKETGKFLRNESGKIIKPKDWKEPDIIGVVKEMYKLNSIE